MNTTISVNLIVNDMEYSIVVNADATLDQILDQLELIPDNNCYFVAFKDDIQLKPLFSLDFQNIQDDDVIIIEQRRISQKKRKSNLEQILRKIESEDEGPDEYYMEAARIADLGFSQWETSPKLPLILREMYDDSTKDHDESENQQIMCKTTTIKAQKVSDQPLPFFFSFDDL